MLQQSLAKLIQGEDLAEPEMMTIMGLIMDGQATPAQIGSFLTALRVKGETVDEVAGAARVMREKSLRVHFDAPIVMDTCGTGGDGANTFNISTTTAFIVAAAGIPVAKHGNRAISSRCGSADVLEALGVRVDLPPEKVEQCLTMAGIGFMFAPLFHQSMKHAAAPRKELGFRTIFNMLGPLTNPARANCQLIGVYQRELTELMARVLQRLGTQRAMVIYGYGGLDELSLEGPNQISFLHDDRVETFTISAAELGMTPAANGELTGLNGLENARLVEAILSGAVRGAKRDVVILNVAAALQVAGAVEDWKAGIALAQELIDNQAAYAKLAALRRVAG